MSEKLEVSFEKAIKLRRSIYSLGKNVSVSEDKITEMIKEVVANSPSAFNSRSTRVVVLFNENHNALWDIVIEQLLKVIPKENAQFTEEKVAAFKAAYATVLFYEDQNVVKDLQESFPLYAENFPVWSEHTNAIHQYAIWTILASEGIGANLQHYNPLIDEEVSKKWDIPSNWKLRAQMPIGSIEAGPNDKDPVDTDVSLVVYK